MDRNTRIARELVKLAKSLVAARKIDSDFEKEIESAIQNQETVSFDYVNKQGKASLVTITPTKIEQKWGKKVVTGTTPWGKELSYLIESMGKAAEDTNGQDTAGQDAGGQVVVLKDDCDFKAEIQKAIDNGSKVKFNYVKKDGEAVSVVMKPVAIEQKWGKEVCTGETDHGERSYFLSSMGAEVLGEEQMFERHPFLKGIMFYTKINKDYYFFKPTGMVGGQVKCDRYDANKEYVDSWTDGDSEEGGRYGWDQKMTKYNIFPDRVVGSELLDIKDEKAYLKDKELKTMGLQQHLVHTESGRINNYRRTYGGGWRRY